jgi:hypothetical protein
LIDKNDAMMQSIAETLPNAAHLTANFVSGTFIFALDSFIGAHITSKQGLQVFRRPA